MAIAVNRFDNTAFTEFLGFEIPSNTTTTWAAIPPIFKKKVSHAYVIGDKQVLTFDVYLENPNPFPYTFPFRDPIEKGGKYVVDSFKVDGQAKAAEMKGHILTADLAELAAGKSCKIQFEVEATFEKFQGQDD